MADADFDVIVVGSGFAGSIAAYVLAKSGRSVLVIERGNSAGSKNMTGGRLYAHSLKQIFPDFEQHAPVERKITHEKISLISEDANFTIDFTSPKLGLEGKDSYSVLSAQFDPWLAEQAEGAGAEYIYGITVEDLLREDGRITGVRAGEDEVTARIVILADGANSLLSEKAGLARMPKPHQMAVGVKELIELDEKTIEDRMQCSPGEGTAWLFAGDVTKGKVGGGFLYANKTTLSLGLVATLSSAAAGTVPVYQMLEDFKNHPAIAPLISGGKTIEYSGHLIPEGGYRMIPELFTDGCMLAGDAAMLCINLGYQVRGMDFAIASGRMAAETALEALDKDDVSAQALSAYREKMDASFVMQDLEAFQRFPDFMEQWTRMFNEYPKLCRDIFLSMFTVDGSPVEPLKKKIMGPLKEVGLLNLAKDVRGAMNSL